METTYAVLVPQLLNAFEASFEVSITRTHIIICCSELSLAQNADFWLHYLVACHVVYRALTLVALSDGSWTIAFYRGIHGNNLEKSAGKKEATQDFMSWYI